jgi:predicted nucleotidyltransferase
LATAGELAQTLRLRRNRAEGRAARLRALLPQAKRALIERYGVRRVILFGSLASGRVSDRSDVDLAVEGMASEVYFPALADLMGLLGCPVDLVRVEDALPSLRAAIDADGVLL